MANELNAMRQERDSARINAERESYYDTVASETEHKDVRDIVASPEFKAWYDKQSDSMKRLAAPGSTMKDNDIFLRAFKAENTGWKAPARKTRDVVVDTQRRERQASDDLHRHTFRGGSSRGGSGSDIQNIEDAQSEFEKAARKFSGK